MTPLRIRYSLWGLFIFCSLLSKLTYAIDRYSVLPLPHTEKFTNISSSAKDRYGFIWYVSHGQLYRHDGHRPIHFSRLSTPMVTFSHIKQIVIDAANRIWLDTNDGLRIFDISTWNFLGTSNLTKNLQGDDILSLCQHDKHVYVVTQTGIVWQINGKHKRSIAHFTVDSPDSSLPTKRACTANDDVFWYVDGKQIYRVNLKNNSINKETIPANVDLDPAHLIPLRNGLLTNSTTGAYYIFDGRQFRSWSPSSITDKRRQKKAYYTQTADGQIVNFFADGTYSSYQMDVSLSPVADGLHSLPQTLFEKDATRSSTIINGLLAGFGGGLFLLQKIDIAFDYQDYDDHTPFPILADIDLEPNEQKMLQHYFSGTVHCITPYHNKSYLIGTNDGIWLFEKETAVPRRFTDSKHKHYSKGQIIRSLVWKAGKLSYTCDDGYFEWKDNTCRKIYPRGHNKIDIYAHTWRNGKTYLATKGTGLIVIDNSNNRSIAYTKEGHGLSDNTIFSMLWRDNLLVLGTSAGISIWEDGKIYSATMQNGLPFGESVPSALWYNKKQGNVYLGGKSGYLTFKPQQMLNSIKLQQPPLPAIAELQITSNTQHTAYKYDITTLSDTIHLSNDILSTSLLLSRPYPLNYKVVYRVSPLMETFQDLPESGQITISNLSPGEYKVEVKSMLPNGLYPATQQWLIYKKSSFYQSQLFYIILIITVGGLCFLALIEKDRSQKRENSLKDKLSKDLHDEVGGLLTGISMQADLLHLQPAQSSIPSSTISSYSREAIQTMDDIIWSLDTAHNNEESLEDRIKFYAHKMLSPLGIEPIFAISPSKPHSIPHDIRQNVFFIFKEAINNVCKHGRSSTVHIQLNLQQNSITLLVKNKISIAQECAVAPAPFKRKGQGMSNMKKRAQSIGAILFCGPTADKTAFCVQLKVSTKKRKLIRFYKNK